MARMIEARHASKVSIEELVAYLDHQVDPYDLDSLASAAPLLAGLANDRRLVVDRLNRQVAHLFRSEATPSAQMIFLGQSTGKDGHEPEFVIRANLWPSMADVSSGRVYQDQFSYHLAHDHNYHFLTVGYHGPGYQTDLYEYEADKVIGEVGEHVDLHFVERVHFRTGMTMLYEAAKDAHVQLPPDDLSVTLNLVVLTPELKLTDQLFFDVQRGVLTAYSPGLDSSCRMSMLRMAAVMADGNTRQLVEDLARTHPCRRTRLEAFHCWVRLAPAEEVAVWECATQDPAPLVAGVARTRLATITRNGRL